MKFSHLAFDKVDVIFSLGRSKLQLTMINFTAANILPSFIVDWMLFFFNFVKFYIDFIVSFVVIILRHFYRAK